MENHRIAGERMDVGAKVLEYIRQNFLFGKDEPLNDQDSLLDRGIIDSTGVMELVTFIETEFGVTVSDKDLVPENLDSLAAITAFIQRKLDQPGASALAAAAA